MIDRGSTEPEAHLDPVKDNLQVISFYTVPITWAWAPPLDLATCGPPTPTRVAARRPAQGLTCYTAS